MPIGKGVVVPAGRLKAIGQKSLNLMTLTLGYENKEKATRRKRRSTQENA